eukprot:CAMPEP_0170065976 /NCGR_PEP_ID=MMETSP0019_2-20121128/5846_1 /TAXON_ID=98059 /ORGANISM="Dinobryon sp., Strain UTEXLB2267" /LENGTH=365 /DNA_ID=CAMNT_0010272949 /DNA_START=742 /DNA_END=1836 /DNA_ORIENTATION=-
MTNSCSSAGLSAVRFHRGSALALRGAYRSCFQALADIVEGFSLEEGPVAQRQLVDATLLLWQLCLHCSEGHGGHGAGRGQPLVVLSDLLPHWIHLLDQDTRQMSLPPITWVCGSIYAGLMRAGLDQRSQGPAVRVSSLLDLQRAPIDPSNSSSNSSTAQRMWRGLFSSPEGPEKVDEGSEKVGEGSEKLEEFEGPEKAALRLSLARLDRSLSIWHASNPCPPSPSPLYHLRALLQEVTTSCPFPLPSPDPSSRPCPARALSLALDLFICGHPQPCAASLGQLQWRGLGATSPQRDLLLRQTLTEALLRSGQLDLARLQLNQRVVLAGEDAQAWRRLAAIHGKQGRDQQAQQAHYTAWQLGIGQGG